MLSESKSQRKRVLYLATRESDYPRVAMTLEGLRVHCDVDAIVVDDQSYLKRLLVVAWSFLWKRRKCYDLVFVGFFAQPIMPLVRLFWRGPLVVDAFISIYDSLVLDKGLSSTEGFTAKLALWLDRFAMKHADVALVDTLEHEKLYRDLTKGSGLPEIYRLWASADEKDFASLAPLSFEPNSGERFEILFWGAFIPLQGVDVIVRAGAKLDPDLYHITIVGTGQTYAHCRKLATDLNVNSVNFESWKTPAELRELASRSHLLLGIFGETEKAKRVIPNKAFQALALGKPLLTGRSAAIAELLSEDKDVILCPMGDPDALADKIEWVRRNWRESLRIAAKGAETFISRASAKDRLGVLAEVVESAGSKRMSPDKK